MVILRRGIEVMDGLIRRALLESMDCLVVEKRKGARVRVAVILLARCATQHRKCPPLLSTTPN